MARLASLQKAGYYPTPGRVVNMIASWVHPNPDAVILDPCCGEGMALATLGKEWEATTLGNELHTERAKAAATRCDQVTHGPIEFLRLKDPRPEEEQPFEIEPQVSCLFLNPPYAEGDENRWELDFLQMSTPWLAPTGLLIYIIPDYIMAPQKGDEIPTYLCEQYEHVQVREFPHPEYERFKQVVILGQKREKPESWIYRERHSLISSLQECPCLDYSYPQRRLPEIAHPPTLSLAIPNAVESQELAARHGPMATETWQNLTNPRGLLTRFQPVDKPLPGHAAMLVLDGRVNGTKVTADNGDPLLLRGTYKKKTYVSEESSTQDGDTLKRRTVEREQVVSVIQALNLTTATVEGHSSDEGEAFEEFLMQHQDKLISAVEELYPPLFVANRDMPKWVDKLRHIHGPRPLPGATTINGVLPKQAEAAVALAMLLERQKCSLLIGECGVGKTTVANALQGLTRKGNFKTVVMAPAQTLDKWQRESERVLQEFGVKSHIIGEKRGKGRGKPILDIIKAMEEDNPSYLIMSFETAKNGAPWKPAFVVRTRKVKWTETKKRRLQWYPYEEEYTEDHEEILEIPHCPDCGQQLADKDGKPWPTNKKAKFWKHRDHRFCPHEGCGAALFQQLPFKYGGRTPAATFLNRHYAGQFDFILDEAHNTKGQDTDIGQASMKLISAARNVIGMTGTIYDGKASGIFAILFRCLPEFRKAYEFRAVQKFVDAHGLTETITTSSHKSIRNTSSWGYGKENTRTREIPGVTPAIISWILRMSVFLRKEHVAAALPSYTEYRIEVEPDEDQRETLRDINNAHATAASKCVKGQMSLMSQWLYAACGALDYGEDDVIEDEDDSFGISGCTRLNKVLPKDQAVLDLVKRELAEGRGVGIYFAQVNRRDWMPRFQALLQKEGIYSEILRADTCKKADREKWFRGLVKRCKAKKQPVVLLANGNLVKEGLDLEECPTLIETGIDFRLINILQRDQRAHRVTQTEPCKVYFFYYKGTFQETALSVVAAKARAAKMVDGKLIEGLAQMGAQEDLMSALLKAALQDKGDQDWTAVDWGDLQVEDIRPQLSPEEASQKLCEAAGPKQTLTVGLLDAVEEIQKAGVKPSQIQIDAGGYQQLSMF